MDLSLPIRSVVPSARADVLVVLARSGKPLSGRQVARLIDGPKQWRVNQVLGELADSGLVLCDEQPPALLYRLNRDHVAAGPIEALANLRSELLDRMRRDTAGWQVPADAVWLYGSFARGQAGPESDIDILIVRNDSIDDDNPTWEAQVMSFREKVHAWSGNMCEVLEVSRSELASMEQNGERLIDELRKDATLLAGVEPRVMLRTPGKESLA